MEINDLKNNVEQEKKILDEIRAILRVVGSSDEGGKKFYLASLKSLKEQVRILNNAIPEILKGISFAKSLSGERKVASGNVARVSYVSPSKNEKSFVTISKEDKEKFLKELSLSEANFGRLKKSEKKGEEDFAPRKIASISSRVFGWIGNGLAPGMKDLKKDLKLANISFLLPVYISIAFFVSFLVLIFGMIISSLLFFLIDFPIWWWFLGPGLFLLCLIGFYLFPSLEKGGLQKRIATELPFATIYMSAISGSDIEPTKIFKIIAKSKEYPCVGVEIKKIISQIEIYGYDLVTALKTVAKQSPSSELAELFGGMATNILTGGSLKNYLEKKADNLLNDYKLERQRYNEVAGTFMDVYISVLITAPLILMMVFVMIGLTGLGGGISLDSLMIFSVIGLAGVNVLFLFILNLKQPKA